MTTVAQRNFASGELSPSLYSRVDFERYATGLRTCRNFFVKRNGGVTNRPGWEFIGEAENSANTVKLIPFVYDNDNAYLLEITWIVSDAFIRFIKDGAYIYETAKNITAITQANPGVFTSNAHGFSNGDRVRIQGIVGMTEVNGQDFNIIAATANTFSVERMDGTDLNTTNFTAYASGGTVKRVYQISFGVSDGVSLVADPFTYTYAQTGNSMVFAHKWGVQELVRTSDTSWALNYLTTFGTSATAPTGLSASVAGAVSNWYITTVKTVTYEESDASSAQPGALPTSGAPNTISWGAVAGRYKYNVYRDDGAGYGFVGSTTSTSFVDRGFTINQAVVPPYNITINNYVSLLDYPAAVCHYQQRRIYAGSPSYPETVAASQIGLYKNFYERQVSQDDDSFAFTLASKSIQRIRHLVDIGKLVAFTDNTILVLNSGEDALTPLGVSVKTQAYRGTTQVPPLVIEESALYVENRGSAIRDLVFDYQVDGYRGTELSLFSNHLIDGYTVTDWAYQQVPNSVVWIVRSDGVLLSFTYIKEQGILGWARHDTDGAVESVAVIPDGTEDAVYVTVKRTIDGRTVRYTEKMKTRVVDDVTDLAFMDSSLTYDGTNATATTMTISGGTTWSSDELLTLTASAAFFTSADVGNEIHITQSDGEILRFSIVNFSSTTVITGYANHDVPVSLQSVATAVWGKAVDTVTNLWHLEDKAVAVFGDGMVVASPNNSEYSTLTVANGQIDLDLCYVKIHVGLPYICDVETLDVDVANGQSLVGRFKNMGKVTCQFEKTRGVWAGAKAPTASTLDGLNELKIRSEEGYDDPTSLVDKDEDIILQTEWNSNGRVFIRQVDPLPVTINSIIGDGLFPFRGGSNG